MRFTWFNLMPWPHLPDDFREKNRSVWVDIDSTLYDPVRGYPTMRLGPDSASNIRLFCTDSKASACHYGNAD